MTKKIIFLLGFFKFSVALALSGQYLPESQLSPSVCEIETYITEHMTYTCTGTIIGTRYFLTSDHCGYNYRGVTEKIKCPGGKTYDVKAILPLDSNRKNGLTEFGNHIYDDVAIAVVTEDFESPALAIPRSIKETENLLRRGQCNMYGYGTDNSGRMGVYHGVTAPLIRDYHNRVIPTLEIDKLKYIPLNRAVNYGDSGGPIVCLNQHGIPYALSVNTWIANRNASGDANQTWASMIAPHRKRIDRIFRMTEEEIDSAFSLVKLDQKTLKANIYKVTHNTFASFYQCSKGITNDECARFSKKLFVAFPDREQLKEMLSLILARDDDYYRILVVRKQDPAEEKKFIQLEVDSSPGHIQNTIMAHYQRKNALKN